MTKIICNLVAILWIHFLGTSYGPAEWWKKTQVPAFGSPLLASYVSPHETGPPEYFLDAYSKMGVTFVNWNDMRWAVNWRDVYPAVVADLHRKGLLVAGTLSMIMALQDITAEEQLRPAIVRDPYGNPLRDLGLILFSVIHPAFQNYMLSDVKTYVDAGVDGIFVDELPYTFGAEEFTWWGTPNRWPAPDHPLSLETLSSYPLLLVPELGDITPNHASILLQYVKQGGKAILFTTPEHIESLTWHRGQTEPSVIELLRYVEAGNTRVGRGAVVTIQELWGKTYATELQPHLRQRLGSLLEDESVLPEVTMEAGNYVSGFMHFGLERITVHFVNYNYDPGSDWVEPVPAFEANVRLPVCFPAHDAEVKFFTPGGSPRALTAAAGGDQITVTVPGFSVWGVLSIENK